MQRIMWSRLQAIRRFTISTSTIEQAVVRHTRISRDHLTPELQLHLLTPDCPLYTADASEVEAYFAEPFWSIYWPGGQALARFILDQGPRLFGQLARAKGRSEGTVSVLDLGAGCGAAAIAAKIAGAGDVLANDIDEVACVAALKNARLNGVKIRATTDDLIGQTLPEPFDVVLVGDLLYDEAIAGRLEAWLQDLADDHGTEIYLGDPGRHGLTDALRRKLTRMCTYALPENVSKENHGYDEAVVWKYLPTTLR